MTGRTHHVLVVEGDEAVRVAISQALRHDGYDVWAVPNGTCLDIVMGTYHPDIALVNVRLTPGPDGFAVGRWLLASNDVRLIFLSTPDELQERLSGFALGADDYLTQPFAIPELVARVGAVLRRSRRADVSGWQVGPIRLDRNAQAASAKGAPLSLTKTEFALLESFCRQPGKVLSKAQLIKEVWAYDGVKPNVVEVHLSVLRKKLEVHVPRLIDTVHGVGYILRAYASSDGSADHADQLQETVEMARVVRLSERHSSWDTSPHCGSRALCCEVPAWRMVAFHRRSPW